MKITKYSIIAIVSVSLITGCVAYGIHTMFLTPEDPEKKLLEEYEKVTENASGPPVITTYGKIPEFENEEQIRDWLNNLDEIRKGVRSEMRPYFYPEGIVVGCGYHYDGYMSISFEKDIVVEKPLMDEIYGIIDKQANEMGIQDVPVVFDLEGLPEESSTDKGTEVESMLKMYEIPKAS
ncbi:MAG: hypothetical protein EF813_01140 [Methanosarcinales archaeon]|nr:MAG: hypothetical protein EF813_01140 [Methanosarcinales archaeon]